MQRGFIMLLGTAVLTKKMKQVHGENTSGLLGFFVSPIVFTCVSEREHTFDQIPYHI